MPNLLILDILISKPILAYKIKKPNNIPFWLFNYKINIIIINIGFVDRYLELLAKYNLYKIKIWS